MTLIWWLYSSIAFGLFSLDLPPKLESLSLTLSVSGIYNADLMQEEFNDLAERVAQIKHFVFVTCTEEIH